ncbi:ferrochelatase [Haliangium sp.]|uniref:ferrochelatase n=1 Tax=Haliangium sp. TaxID=2663208 RepID=UPI003D100742
MTGLLLINLGTPDEPTTGSVRRYLREFLSDPRVVDINPVGRFLLLNLIILPFRPAKSAEAYRKVWTDRGSPLLFHGRDLASAVGERLGPSWQVELAMRYGNPSIAAAFERFRQAGVDHIVVLPLFPQYASSSTGSALEAVFRRAAQYWNVPRLSVIEDFYADPGMLDAFAAVGRPVMETLDADHVLFSFHGLPERQVQKSDDSGRHCLIEAGCCDRMVAANRNCYRAQCFATARHLATRLSLDEDDYTICFQSRLGRVPWIKPYTDEVLDELAAAGKKRLAVFCPAFVADCLETLEEIGIRAKEQFVAAGGEDLALVPSLNSEPAWADAVAAMARRYAGAAAPTAELDGGTETAA